MLKRFLLVLALLAGVLRSAIAVSKQDTIPPFIGISYIPSLKWYVHNSNTDDGDLLKYNFKYSNSSYYEGSFGIKSIGARVGLSAQLDGNLIGKIHRYGGYFGIKGFWLKLQGGKLEGSTEWLGALPTGFSSKHNFSNKFFSVELLKAIKEKHSTNEQLQLNPTENQIMGLYWGVGYSSISMPVKISTLVTPGGRENQEFGVPAYDTLFVGKYYTIGFGWDILRQLCLVGGKYSILPGQRAMRFGIYAATQDKIGFGSSELSKHAKEMGEALNPDKTMVDLKAFSTSVNFSLSAGFRYIIFYKPAFLVFAVGYDLEGAGIVTFGGAADTSSDLGYNPDFLYLNHGLSFKLYMSWVGRE